MTGIEVRELLQKKGYILADIAEKLGISAQTLNSRLNAKNFKEEYLIEISNVIGKDLIETRSAGIQVKETRPHIPISAVAGKLCEYYATVKESDCERYPLIAGLPDYNFTIPVTGNSMIPEYRSGDIVACKYVEHEDFIQWGKSYIIDTTQGIVFKKVMPIDTDDNSILCVSINKEEFPSYKLKKEFIYSMAVVVGIARRE